MWYICQTVNIELFRPPFILFNLNFFSSPPLVTSVVFPFLTGRLIFGPAPPHLVPHPHPIHIP